MRKTTILTLGLTLGISAMYACTDQNKEEMRPPSVLLQDAIDPDDDPSLMGLQIGEYEAQFSELPQKGFLSYVPWSDTYYPTHEGGITNRWNRPGTVRDKVFYPILQWADVPSTNITELSSSEKYDIYVGDPNFSFTRAERKRTQVMRTLKDPKFKIPFWEGLCHAWAPATLLFENPGPVTAKNPDGIDVPFGSTDIKALLTYFLHNESSMTFFASKRCDVDAAELRQKLDRGEITSAYYTRVMESLECRGIHPGAFQIILGNMIGLQGKGFVADVTRDQQVWNQAVFGYETSVLAIRTSGFSRGADRRTVKEVKVKTVMHYTQEIERVWDRIVTPASNRTVDYIYWLELNARGEIIGGTWVSDARPDFLWMRTLPEFEGPFAPLKELYELSIADAG